MAKKTNKLIFVLVAFVAVIVGTVVLIIALGEAQPIVNSLAFGYLNEEESYQRFFFKEIYMTGSQDDALIIKVFVNDSVEQSTNSINWGISNPALISIVEDKENNTFVFKPKSEGDVTITAQSQENSEAIDTCVISIKQKSFTAITVSKINEIKVGNDGVLNIYNINQDADNNRYNRVYLNLNQGNANSLSVLQYDDTKIEDIFIDPLTFTLQIKTRGTYGSTLVKLGWKEVDASGEEHIIGQQDFVFNICQYGINTIGFRVYTSSDLDGEGIKLTRTGANYNLYLGTDELGNNHNIVYVKPYYVYSSGWENDTELIQPQIDEYVSENPTEQALIEQTKGCVCSEYVYGEGLNASIYYIIDITSIPDEYDQNTIKLLFSNEAIASSIKSTLTINRCAGSFETYFG